MRSRSSGCLGISVPRRGAAHPGALLRDRPPFVASAPDHDASERRRRDDADSLGVRGAREADGVLRARERLTHARGLLPSGRRPPGSAAQTDRRHRGFLRSVPCGLRRYGNPAHRKPHLQAAQCRHRRGQAGGRLGMGLLGRDGARLRRALGPAQGAAVRMLRGNGVRHPRRQKRRLLRSICDPHGGNAPVDQDHASSAARS